MPYELLYISLNHTIMGKYASLGVNGIIIPALIWGVTCRGCSERRSSALEAELRPLCCAETAAGGVALGFTASRARAKLAGCLASPRHNRTRSIRATVSTHTLIKMASMTMSAIAARPTFLAGSAKVARSAKPVARAVRTFAVKAADEETKAVAKVYTQGQPPRNAPIRNLRRFVGDGRPWDGKGAWILVCVRVRRDRRDPSVAETPSRRRGGRFFRACDAPGLSREVVLWREGGFGLLGR